MRASIYRQRAYDDDALVDIAKLGQLRCQASDLGIEIDVYWGVSRLQKEIAKMRNAVDVFLGDVKCQLQRFEPKPGDVFVLTFPDEIPLEVAKRMRSD